MALLDDSSCKYGNHKNDIQQIKKKQRDAKKGKYSFILILSEKKNFLLKKRNKILKMEPQRKISIVEAIINRKKVAEEPSGREGKIYPETPSPVTRRLEQNRTKKEKKKEYIGKYKLFFDKMCKNSIVDIYVITSEKRAPSYFVEAFTPNFTTYFVEIPACDEQCNVVGIATYTEVEIPLNKSETIFGLSLMENLNAQFGVISENGNKLLKYDFKNSDTLLCYNYIRNGKRDQKHGRDQKNFVLIKAEMIDKIMISETEIDEIELREMEIFIEKMNRELKIIAVYAQLIESQEEIKNITDEIKRNFNENDERHSMSTLGNFASDIYASVQNFNRLLHKEENMLEEFESGRSFNLDPFMAEEG